MKEFDFEKTPIVDIANEILLDGTKQGASDIHFDPYKDGLAIRMRVDGVLYDYSTVPANYKRNMISRIKMIASMNIMETRLPQDGAIKSKIGDKTLDLRVSSLPTHNGEKVVLRILDYSKSLQGLETLGFSEHNLNKIIKMIEIPNGIVLVTGATGSGKSTTVYSILQKLNTREVNIITVEDPVEMEVEGLNQVQAQQEIGLDFATVLRSILRQDPDIIMIGEIRDTETARIAVRASITGHKVLSTIHTNSALNTIERLTDMDVERYLIGTSLNGIISQKLARKLCPHCRIARETNDFEKSLFKTVLHKEVDKVYDVNPQGCEHCFKGYKNRIAIAEVLVITDNIRSAITEAEPKEVMRKLVYYDGQTHTLLEDGLEKIELGETNFDEIFKLVDIENDLAVAKSIYDEVEKDMHNGHKEQKEEEEDINALVKEELSQNNTPAQEEPKQLEQNIEETKPQEEVTVSVPLEETTTSTVANDVSQAQEQVSISQNPPVVSENVNYKDNSNNIIEILDTDDEDDNPQEEQLTIDDSGATQEEKIETFEDLDEPKQEEKLETFEDLDEPKQEEKIETFEDLVSSKDEPLETLEDLGAAQEKQLTFEDLDEPKQEEQLEVFDETPKDNTEQLEVFDENITNEFDNNTQTPVNEEQPLDENNVLTNPMASDELPLETFKDLDSKKEEDSSVNYDQMMKVPFIDETLDL